MSENKFCTKCGAPLRDGVQFCTECGTRVGGDATQTVQPTASVNPNVGVNSTNQPQYSAPVYSPIPDENQKMKNDKQGKIIAGVFGLIAVLAIVFLVYKGFFSYPSKPADVAEKFINAVMVDFDAKSAQKYIVSEVDDYDEIKEICEAIEDSGIKVKKVKVSDTEVDGDYAEVTLSITVSLLGQTETQDADVSLEKINGKWKVIDFD
ncbi:zinc-ribbon domain-containing protein [Anaerosporobacter sp.]